MNLFGLDITSRTNTLVTINRQEGSVLKIRLYLLPLVAIGLSANVATPPAKTWPCQFAAHRVIGCRQIEDAELAANLWQKYRLNTEQISEGERAWMADRLCQVIATNPGKVWEIFLHGKGRVPTESGYEPIINIDLPRRGVMFVMSSHYVLGTCPTFKGEETYRQYHPD